MENDNVLARMLGVEWFSNVKGCIGIVLYEDNSGKERASISVVDGIDEEADARFIMQWGAKFPVSAAKKLIQIGIPTKNSPQVEKQIDDKIADVTKDMEPGKILRMQMEIDKDRN